MPGEHGQGHAQILRFDTGPEGPNLEGQQVETKSSLSYELIEILRNALTFERVLQRPAPSHLWTTNRSRNRHCQGQVEVETADSLHSQTS